jgi:hypothetical protein
VAVTAPAAARRAFAGVETFWSPYYEVEYYAPSIFVDNIGYQQMVPFDTGGSVYSLIHLLRRAAGDPPFRDELIIGAGSGNDINHALHYGVGRVDAVEIDPVIQSIGISRNPDRPYAPTRGSFPTSTMEGIFCVPPSANTIWSCTRLSIRLFSTVVMPTSVWKVTYSPSKP